MLKPCRTFLLFNKKQEFWWLNESFGALGGRTTVEKPRRSPTRMPKGMGKRNRCIGLNLTVSMFGTPYVAKPDRSPSS